MSQLTLFLHPSLSPLRAFASTSHMFRSNISQDTTINLCAKKMLWKGTKEEPLGPGVAAPQSVVAPGALERTNRANV